MMIRGYSIAGRTIALIVGGIVLFLLVSFALYQCQQRRSERAQSRVDAAQAEAQSNSAADAIGTVSRRGAEETASEELTRDNERDIRAAEGAGDRVNMDVHSAGLKALCKRAAYRDDKRCAPFRKDAR